MLRIRRDQMEILRTHTTELFVARMCAHLRARLPEPTATLDERALAERVRNAHQRARACGITLERDVKSFLEIDLAHGPDFGRAPATAWIAAILADESIPGPAKMRRIEAEELVRLRSGA